MQSTDNSYSTSRLMEKKGRRLPLPPLYAGEAGQYPLGTAAGRVTGTLTVTLNEETESPNTGMAGLKPEQCSTPKASYPDYDEEEERSERREGNRKLLKRLEKKCQEEYEEALEEMIQQMNREKSSQQEEQKKKHKKTINADE